MMRFVRGCVLVVVTGGALLLPACNNDETLPTPGPTVPQTVRAVVAVLSFTDFPTDIYQQVPIPLPQAGILDFTVDWTFTTTYMDVAFGTQDCTFTQLNTNKCPFVTLTTGTTPKPRVITTQPLAVGNYYIYFYSKPYKKSDGTGSGNIEAVSMQIGLTVGQVATPHSAQMAPLRLQAHVIKP